MWKGQKILLSLWILEIWFKWKEKKILKLEKLLKFPFSLKSTSNYMYTVYMDGTNSLYSNTFKQSPLNLLPIHQTFFRFSFTQDFHAIDELIKSICTQRLHCFDHCSASRQPFTIYVLLHFMWHAPYFVYQFEYNLNHVKQ